MKTCRRCHVKVTDDTNLCPLCRTVLSDFDGNQPESMYPDVDWNVRRYNVITRIFLFLSIVGGIAAVVTNYYTYHGVLWSILMVAAILYSWAVIIHSVKHHVNVAAKILVQALCASALVVIVDFVLGYDGWSVNYMVPSFFSLANLAVLIIITVNRMDWHNYVMYQLGIGLFGFVPIILFLCGLIDRPLITVIATGIASLTLIGTIIFGEKTVKSELQRRFHV
jgi:hypothetical protein